MTPLGPSSGDTFAFATGERAALPRRVAEHAERLARLVVAIDGPAGSGKSTTARAVAGRLGLRYLDTGAMYRALTLLALRQGTDLEDGAALARLDAEHAIDVEQRNDDLVVRIDGTDVSAAVRGPDVTRAVSRVSAHAAVRAQMVRRQRQIGSEGGVAVDGRDIGTVVFPDADVKVFLVADVRTRARRRQAEDAQRGVERALDEIEADIARRDAADSTRSVSPLVRAPDAVLLDTTRRDVESQVDAVLALCLRAALGAGRGAGTAARPAAPRAPAGVARAELVTLDPQEWAQPGYRAFPSRIYRVVHDGLRFLVGVVLGARLHVHPAARLPGSALVACNHVAGLDPLVAGSSIPFETWYVAKLELFQSAWLARLLQRFNAIPIRRRTADFEALDRAVQLLRSGHNLFMFPEGTRQRSGRLGEPKWGFGYVAVHAGRPVVPVFVRGTRDGRPRWLRRQPLEVWVGEPVAIQLSPGSLEHDLYKQVGTAVMERIAGLMLRSAGDVPLAGLDLPGEYAATTRVVPTPRSGPGTLGTTRDSGPKSL